ncbi:MAG: hypothetical protein ACTSO9_17695 [Candidatus Helarchaeota archaeon]
MNSETENKIEFDKDINGYIIKYRCPNCGRRYKVKLEQPKSRNIRCNFCKYMVKIRINQNGITVQ